MGKRCRQGEGAQSRIRRGGSSLEYEGRESALKRKVRSYGDTWKKSIPSRGT